MFCESGTRKKKGLTDPVEIIPFPGQTLRGAASKPVAKPSVGTERSMVPPLKKEVKALSSPTGKLSTNTISIEEMKRQQLDQPVVQVEDYTNRPKDDFTYDDLKIIWRKFAFKIREEGLNGADSMSLALSKRDPKLEGTHIHAEFDNTIIIDVLQRDFLSMLIEYLRKNLNNWSITFDFSLAESQEDENRHLTSKEKFEILSKKNVNLITLQKTFNLDLDY